MNTNWVNEYIITNNNFIVSIDIVVIDFVVFLFFML
jgi:hypothetical protein